MRNHKFQICGAQSRLPTRIQCPDQHTPVRAASQVSLAAPSSVASRRRVRGALDPALRHRFLEGVGGQSSRLRGLESGEAYLLHSPESELKLDRTQYGLAARPSGGFRPSRCRY